MNIVTKEYTSTDSCTLIILPIPQAHHAVANFQVNSNEIIDYGYLISNTITWCKGIEDFQAFFTTDHPLYLYKLSTPVNIVLNVKKPCNPELKFTALEYTQEHIKSTKNKNLVQHLYTYPNGNIVDMRYCDSYCELKIFGPTLNTGLSFDNFPHVSI